MKSATAKSSASSSAKSKSKTKDDNDTEKSDAKKQSKAKQSNGIQKSSKLRLKTKSSSSSSSKQSGATNNINNSDPKQQNDCSQQKSSANEMKLFQNSRLLNQRDPIEQLHEHLSELINDTEPNAAQSQRQTNAKHKLSNKSEDCNNNKQDGANGNDDQNCHHNQTSLSLPPVSAQNNTANDNNTETHGDSDQQQQVRSHSNNAQSTLEEQVLDTNPTSQAIVHLHNNQQEHVSNNSNNIRSTTNMSNSNDNEDGNIFTVKKGILWQQQIFDKFHLRLFSRWKKRYFILTTDYLVCFKRSASKVGRSEMGEFLYKLSLNDIKKVEWLNPKKSDKGAIVLFLSQPHNLYLWTKHSLDEWMLFIIETVTRNKLRRAALGRNVSNINNNGLIHAGSYLARNTTADNFGIYRNQNSNKNPICLYENANEFAKRSFIEPVEAEAASRLEIEQHSACSGNRGSGEKQHSDERPEVASKPSDLDNNNSSGKQQHAPVTGIKNSLNETTLNSVASSESCPQTGSSHRRALDCQDNGAYSSGERYRRRVDEDQSEPFGIIARDNKKSLADDELGQRQQNRASMMINEVQTIMDSKQSSGDDDDRSPANKGYSAAPEKRRRTNGLCENDEQLIKDRSNHDNTIGSGGCSTNLSARSQIEAAGSPKAEEQSKLCHRQRQPVACSSPSSNIGRSQQQQQRQMNMFASERSGDFPVDPLRQLPKRPMSNLIRRDDSWQSLVSLARIGRETPTKALPGVAQRSLYAQHIMPTKTFEESLAGNERTSSNNNNGTRDLLLLSETHRRHLINIESTVTPIRGGRLLRHQSSVQAPKMRPLPPLGLDRNAASFDLASTSTPPPTSSTQPLPFQAGQFMSPTQQKHLQQQQQQQQQLVQPDTQKPPLSYHQKLLQLQLLHNSNNVDYIRNNGDIYACDTNSNHYGYYSMRSNLKSAASEFSFIRPSNTGNIHGQQVQLAAQNFYPNMMSKQPIHMPSSLARRFRGLPESSPQAQLHLQKQQSLDYSSDGALSRINNNVVEPIAPLIEVAPAAPNRELPLKPPKRKNGQTVVASKNSSLTSGIVSFFRRAFSRSSKTKSKNLPESCSSSIFAYDDRHPFATNIDALPSAFSTGSKSIDQEANELPQQVQRQQRMIDMVEAFKNKAIIDEDARIQQQQQRQQQQQLMSPLIQPQPHRLASASFYGNPNQQVLGLNQMDGRAVSPCNQFGSPLHKSNSVSASMGFGTLRDVVDGNRYNMLLQEQETRLMAQDRYLSPMITRSTKVMSANLTPIRRSGREDFDDSDGRLQQSVMSPRRLLRPDQTDHLPRPSSIYGQPSLVAPNHLLQTPERTGNAFGLHRGSLHSQLRDRNGSNGSNVIESSRRHHHHHQMKKLPCLDTTREVAEEMSSPTTTMPAASEMIGAFDHERGTPPVYKHERSLIANRQAVVNPILQSPIANTIYDNHPANEPIMASHYDNGGAHFSASASASSRCATESPRPFFRRPPSSSSRLNDGPQESTYYVHQLHRHDHSPNVARTNRMTSNANDVTDPTATSNAWIHGTPLRDKRVTDMMLTYNKPAAIIAPNTPDRSRISTSSSSSSSHRRQDHPHKPRDSSFHDDSSPYQVSNVSSASILQATQSPMINRRLIQREDPNLGLIQHAAQYQQSPRADRNLNCSDGASCAGEKYDDSGFGSGDYGRHKQRLFEPELKVGINPKDTFVQGIESMHQQSSQEASAAPTRLSKTIASEQLRDDINDDYDDDDNDGLPGRKRLTSNQNKQRSVDRNNRGALRGNPNRADSNNINVRDVSFELTREASSSSTGSRSTATTDTRSSSAEWKASSRMSSGEVAVGGGGVVGVRDNEDCSKRQSSFGSFETSANQVAASHFSNGTHNALDREGDNKGNRRLKRGSTSNRVKGSSTDQSNENLESCHDSTVLGSEPEEHNWITSKLVE